MRKELLQLRCVKEIFAPALHIEQDIRAHFPGGKYRAQLMAGHETVNISMIHVQLSTSFVIADRWVCRPADAYTVSTSDHFLLNTVSSLIDLWTLDDDDFVNGWNLSRERVQKSREL